MCLDSEKRIGAANDEHPEEGNDNQLNSRWVNRSGHVGNGHIGSGRIGNGYAAPAIPKDPVELFPSPDHSAASTDTSHVQNAPKSKVC